MTKFFIISVPTTHIIISLKNPLQRNFPHITRLFLTYLSILYTNDTMIVFEVKEDRLIWFIIFILQCTSCCFASNGRSTNATGNVYSTGL